MGIYLDPDSSKFEEAVNSDIYIDKTGLITYTNAVLHTMQKYICISRPRRFGKSTAANKIPNEEVRSEYECLIEECEK